MTDTLAHVDEGAHEDEHELITVTGISNEKLGMWVFLASECLLFGGLISTYMLYKNRSGITAGGHGSPLRMSDFYDIPFTSVSSFILLASSLTMVMAVTAAHRYEPAKVRRWLATTAVLGAIFVGGQVYEFTGFVREGRAVRTEVIQHQADVTEAAKTTSDKDYWKDLEPLAVKLPSKDTVYFRFQQSGEVTAERDGAPAVRMDPTDIGAGFTSSVSSSAFLTLTGFHGVHVTIGIIMLLTTIGMSMEGRLPRRKAESVEIVGLYWHFVDVVWILIFTVVYLIK